MSNLAKYRREAKNAARDLGYGSKVIEAIRKAKTEEEIIRIMQNARKGI